MTGARWIVCVCSRQIAPSAWGQASAPDVPWSMSIAILTMGEWEGWEGLRSLFLSLPTRPLRLLAIFYAGKGGSGGREQSGSR